MPKSNKAIAAKRANKMKQNKIPRTIEQRLMQYIDFGFSASITSTPLDYKITDPIRTQILPSFPSLWRPSLVGWSPGVKKINAKIRLDRMDVRILATGAQSTTLLAGDLYNSIRLCVYKTGNSPLDTQPTPLSNITEFLNLTDVTKVYVDRVIALPSQAFDSVNSYNVPQVVQQTFSVPLGFELDWFTNTANGSDGWDTRKDGLDCSFVSDSTVSPHPNLEFRVRLYYSY